MSAPDYTRAARNLRVLGDTMHTQAGDDCLHAAKLCEAMPEVEKLLLLIDNLPLGRGNCVYRRVYAADLASAHAAAKRLRKALQP